MWYYARLPATLLTVDRIPIQQSVIEEKDGKA